MAVTDAQRRLAYLAGRLAARNGKPLTSCPYDPRAQRTLTLWFVRGHRSLGDPAAVSYRD